MSNSAARILAVFDQLLGFPDSMPACTAWGRALGCSTPNEGNKKLSSLDLLKVFRRLAELGEEVEVLQRVVREKYGVKSQVFIDQLDPVRNFIVRVKFDTTLGNSARSPGDGAIVNLRNLSVVLGDESDITYEEVQELRCKVQELIESFRIANLELQVKDWVLKVLHDLLFRLEMYDLHGAKVFAGAYIVLLGEIENAADELEETAHSSGSVSEVNSKLSQLLDSIQGFARRAVKTTCLAIGLLRVGEAVSNLTREQPQAEVRRITGPVLDELERIDDLMN